MNSVLKLYPVTITVIVESSKQKLWTHGRWYYLVV